jgi:hypothetical protein
VRITKLLRILLGLEETSVVDVGFNEAGLVIDIAPTWRRPRCSDLDLRRAMSTMCYWTAVMP